MGVPNQIKRAVGSKRGTRSKVHILLFIEPSANNLYPRSFRALGRLPLIASFAPFLTHARCHIRV